MIIRALLSRNGVWTVFMGHRKLVEERRGIIKPFDGFGMKSSGSGIYSYASSSNATRKSSR
jgi:hypothetical protein